MASINKIRLSGQTYDIQDANAQPLLSAGTGIDITDNVISATGGDLTNYYTKTETNTLLGGKADTATTYTKTEVDNAITAATSTKQDTLISGTNIKTINNESILGSGNIDIQGGGGITSGEVQTMIDNSLSGYVYTADNGKQDIYGSKTFIGEKRISFTQGTSSNKPGFTIYGVRDAEGNASQLGTFELNPTAITESNTTFPLLSLGHYRSGNRRASVQSYIGFRQYDYDNSAAYHLLAPLPQNAKTPFSLTTSFQNFYMPLGIKVDNSTMVKADSGGVMDISSYIGGGGGGKAIEAGRGISITTGETADTVSFNLPISAGTSTNSIIIGFSGNTATGNYSVAVGANSHASKNGAFAEGSSTASGYYSHAEGSGTIASGDYSHAEGLWTIANNSGEHASGRYNNSVSGSSTFGDSGNTLFSVGNGTSDSARHNAFEIRQNGDIYFNDGTNDVKLQDKFTEINNTIGDIETLLASI